MSDRHNRGSPIFKYAEPPFRQSLTAQWFVCPSGVLGTCIAFATITTAARGVPRTVMLLAVGSGAVIVDAFIGIGVGWRWHHGILSLSVIALLVEMTWSCAHRLKVGRPRRR
ncbi:hypothetical protein GCM10022247_73180 [Allokutzneria multivorans]|uniref:Uncharacterized protein n=1 Tax=Allokutzneria multivorans TaxID=1142134 RepID=A0ABP7U638_9PSEU